MEYQKELPTDKPIITKKRLEMYLAFLNHGDCGMGYVQSEGIEICHSLLRVMESIGRGLYPEWDNTKELAGFWEAWENEG